MDFWKWVFKEHPVQSLFVLGAGSFAVLILVYIVFYNITGIDWLAK